MNSKKIAATFFICTLVSLLFFLGDGGDSILPAFEKTSLDSHDATLPDVTVEVSGALLSEKVVEFQQSSDNESVNEELIEENHGTAYQSAIIDEQQKDGEIIQKKLTNEEIIQTYDLEYGQSEWGYDAEINVYENGHLQAVLDRHYTEIGFIDCRITICKLGLRSYNHNEIMKMIPEYMRTLTRSEWMNASEARILKLIRTDESDINVEIVIVKK